MDDRGEAFIPGTTDTNEVEVEANDTPTEATFPAVLLQENAHRPDVYLRSVNFSDELDEKKTLETSHSPSSVGRIRRGQSRNKDKDKDFAGELIRSSATFASQSGETKDDDDEAGDVGMEIHDERRGKGFEFNIKRVESFYSPTISNEGASSIVDTDLVRSFSLRVQRHSRQKLVMREQVSTADQILIDTEITAKLRTQQLWHFILCLLVLYNAFIVPYRIAFDLLPGTKWTIIDLCLDLLFWARLVLKFHTPVEEQGTIYSSPNIIAWKYVGQERFAIDVIGILPLELIGIALNENPYAAYLPYWRLNRILYVYHIPTFVVDSFLYFFSEANPFFSNILIYIILILFMVHGFACGYFFLWMRLLTTTVWDEDIWSLSFALPYSRVHQWLLSFMWSMKAIFAEHPRWPVTDQEFLYNLFTHMIGLGMEASVISFLAHLLESVGHEAEEYCSVMSEVQDTMKRMKLPFDFQDEVVAHLKQQWKTTKSFQSQEGDLLEDLPEEIKERVDHGIMLSVLKRMQIFKQVQGISGASRFCEQLALALRQRHYAAGEIMVRKGDVGAVMFLISKGVCSVIDADRRPIYTFNPGDFFGELVMLGLAPTRTATVMAHTLTIVYTLSKEDYLDISQEFPECAQVIRHTAEERMSKVKKS